LMQVGSTVLKLNQQEEVVIAKQLYVAMTEVNGLEHR